VCILRVTYNIVTAERKCTNRDEVLYFVTGTFVVGVWIAKYDFGSVFGSVLQKSVVFVWVLVCKNPRFLVLFSVFTV